MVWTLVEPGVAIVASSLVTIRPLLRQMRLKGFADTTKRRPSLGRRRGRGRGTLLRDGQGNERLSTSHVHARGAAHLSPGSHSKSQWTQVPDDDVELKDLEAGLCARDPRRDGVRISHARKETTSRSHRERQHPAQMQTGTMTAAAAAAAAAAAEEDDHHDREDREKVAKEAKDRSPYWAPPTLGIVVATSDAGGVSLDSPTIPFGPGRHHVYTTSESSYGSILFIEGRVASTAMTISFTAPKQGDNDAIPQGLDKSEETQGLRRPLASVVRKGRIADDDGESKTSLVSLGLSSSHHLHREGKRTCRKGLCTD